jgi:hypothetical protein
MNQVFECGTWHRSSEITASDATPAMVKTLHNVWFRGNAPSEDEVRTRIASQLAADIEQTSKADVKTSDKSKSKSNNQQEYIDQ